MEGQHEEESSIDISSPRDNNSPLVNYKPFGLLFNLLMSYI